MENKIYKSPLLNRFTCTQIPFGIDLNLFRPKRDKDCRERFSIPQNHNVIAFRNSGIKNDKFKGLLWLLKALEIYVPQKPTTILMIEGDKGFENLEDKYHIIKTGWIDGEDIVSHASYLSFQIAPIFSEFFTTSTTSVLFSFKNFCIVPSTGILF